MNPELVTIVGFTGPAAEDPVISPDGNVLFFDTHFTAATKSVICWAWKTDYKTFTYMGPVASANGPGWMTLRGNYDLAHNFYWIANGSSGVIGQGVFNAGAVTGAHPVLGIGPQHGGNAIFDVCISPDGGSMFFTSAFVQPNGQALWSRMSLASKNPDGSFSIVQGTDQTLAQVNNTTPIVYNAAPLPGGALLVFSADVPMGGPRMFASRRASAQAPFGVPQHIRTVDIGVGEFSEAGGFDPTGEWLYFHRVMSDTESVIYVLPASSILS